MRYREDGPATAGSYWNRLRRLMHDNSGVTVIEFAMVAGPFFALLIAAVQTTLIFFASQVLESGVADAARLIRTGQAQNQEMNASMFKQAVCDNIYGLLDCENGLMIDVRTIDSFGSADVGRPINRITREVEDDFRFAPGAGGDIVVVRAFYEWPLIFPTLGVSPANLASGNFLLSSAAAFRNEPF